MNKHIIPALIAGFLANSAAAETPVEEAAVVFGARQAILDISLSPSGNKIAYVSPVGLSSEAIFVVDLNSSLAPRPLLQLSDENAELGGCEWPSETHIVCLSYFQHNETGTILGYSRVFSLDVSTGETVSLTPEVGFNAVRDVQFGGRVLALDIEDDPNRVLMSRVWVEERANASRLTNDENGYGVEAVDVATGKRRRVEAPDQDTVSYLADQHGNVRVRMWQGDRASGYAGDRMIAYFREPGSKRWLPLSTLELNGQGVDGFYPVAVDSDRNVAYAFDDHHGYEALYEIDLEEGATPRLLLSVENAEVDGLVRIGRQRRVVGASYATDYRRTIYFDEELERLTTQLSQALPGNPAVSVVDASADEQTLLIRASSDVNPGTIYLYEKASRSLSELLPVRDHMDGRTLSKMVPITYPSTDGTLIPGYLSLPAGSEGKNLPGIVMPHGGPSARDEWGFDWLVQFFTARGYAVLQPNYRGSSGYGRDWFGQNGFQGWATAIGDINDAGRWLVSEGMVDPDKLAIVGWSYGGYSALQSQVVDPDLYRAIVAIAPVADLAMLKRESRRYVSGALAADFIGEGPHVAEGSPAQNTDRFRSPVLLVHGDMDQNVDINQSRFMKGRLEGAGKAVEYIEFKNLDHSLRESKARYEMLKKIDAFLEKNLAG